MYIVAITQTMSTVKIPNLNNLTENKSNGIHVFRLVYFILKRLLCRLALLCHRHITMYITNEIKLKNKEIMFY